MRRWGFAALALAVCFLGLTGCGGAAPGIAEAAPSAMPPSPTAQLATPTPPTATPEPTPPPTPTPNPDDRYFTEAGEEITANAEAGWWSYHSPGLSVEISRKHKQEPKLTYYVAHIRLRGERENSGFGRMDPSGDRRESCATIARRYRAVYAQSGDFLTTSETEQKGILIRDGRLFSDRQGEDTLAFLPDGSLAVYAPGETDGQSLLEQGVRTAYSFGPTLVRAGEITQDVMRHRVARSRNPRSAIGMVQPGHLVGIVVEGRVRDSVGVKMDELAQLFVEEGCELAYNLDGGASVGIVFMGEKLNQSSTARSMPDCLLYGYSLATPPMEDKIGSLPLPVQEQE